MFGIIVFTLVVFLFLAVVVGGYIYYANNFIRPQLLDPRPLPKASDAPRASPTDAS